MVQLASHVSTTAESALAPLTVLSAGGDTHWMTKESVVLSVEEDVVLKTRTG